MFYGIHSFFADDERSGRTLVQDSRIGQLKHFDVGRNDFCKIVYLFEGNKELTHNKMIWEAWFTWILIMALLALLVVLIIAVSGSSLSV